MAQKTSLASIQNNYNTSCFDIYKIGLHEMHIQMAAEGFSALGNETRIAIFRVLIQAGENGLSTGRIADEIEIPLSTLAHHLLALERTGLINQHKSGRKVTNTANYPVMQALIDYLTDKCCQGLASDRPIQSSKLSSRELTQS